MKSTHLVPILLLLFHACAPKTALPTAAPLWQSTDSLRVTAQLDRMVKAEQDIQFAHAQGESKRHTDSLYARQSEIFRANTDTLQALFGRYGFMGFDKVGERGAHAFWLMVQHADHDTAFQSLVLDSMLVHVRRNNASGPDYAYLTDRVLKNAERKQLYGTQLQYTADFWVIPEALQDSTTVNERRAAIGLTSIEAYLNKAMRMHFQYNQEVYERNGPTGPRVHGEGE